MTDPIQQAWDALDKALWARKAGPTKNKNIIALETGIMFALSALSQCGWQPISTAPRDTEVLLYFGMVEHYGIHIASGWCSTKGWCSYEFFTGEPTHWMPLPPPPRQGDEHDAV